MKTFALTAALALTVGIVVNAQAKSEQTNSTTSVAGKWNMSVDTPSGTLPSELNLKLDGKKVTGTIASQMGEAPIEGEFADGKLSLSMSFQGASGSGQVTF